MFAGGSEKGSRYTLIDKVTTFYGGQERCQKLGGYLVHINSLREQLFIEDFISQDLNQRHGTYNWPVWLAFKMASLVRSHRLNVD